MIYRNRLFKAMRKIDSKDVKARTHDMQRHRKKYIVSESDFV